MYSIYMITNKVNGKIYIGMTKGTPEWRFSIHVKAARNGKKKYHFANAIRKYGADNFSIKTIDTTDTEDEARELETYYILDRKSRDPNIGYNMTAGGEGGITEEVRRKLSIALRGKVRTPAMRKRMSEARMGVKTGPRSEKHKENMSRIMKGRFMGPESSTWRKIPMSEVISMYRDGLSSRDIAEKMNVTNSTITSRLKLFGVKVRPRWNKSVENLEKARRFRGEACPWSRLTEVEVKQIRDLCLCGVMSQSQIGRAYGVTQGNVWRIHKGESWKGI